MVRVQRHHFRLQASFIEDPGPCGRKRALEKEFQPGRGLHDRGPATQAKTGDREWNHGKRLG